VKNSKSFASSADFLISWPKNYFASYFQKKNYEEQALKERN